MESYWNRKSICFILLFFRITMRWQISVPYRLVGIYVFSRELSMGINYTDNFEWVVINHPCLNFNDCLAKTLSNLGHEWVISSHHFIWIWLLIIAFNSVLIWLISDNKGMFELMQKTKPKICCIWLKSEIPVALLLTWFNFNPSMDK